jgi:hypothetical protein
LTALRRGIGGWVATPTATKLEEMQAEQIGSDAGCELTPPQS